jgi:hypothetical protein
LHVESPRAKTASQGQSLALILHSFCTNRALMTSADQEAAAGYNAFARYATNDDDAMMHAASSTAAMRPYAPAAPSSSVASAALHLYDESATSWLTRDSTQQHVPNAIRHLQGSVHLWKMMPCCVDDDHQQQTSSATEFGGVDEAEGGGLSTRVRHRPNFMDPKLHVGQSAVACVGGTFASRQRFAVRSCALAVLAARAPLV